ncbi:MAG TPA: DNA-processing protein DprA [Polyangiaceae bacterium]|nr:DNA-processing protein DprA [Polyangiaceae bacterium]
MASSLPARLSGSTLPAALAALPTAPRQLFLHGSVPQGPCVGIVGTRRPSFEAAAYAFQLAQCLACYGVTVISGGALGIDTQAHEGALAGGGKTVIVGPSSFDRPYPSENAALFARAVHSGGAYLSAFEKQVPARNAHFFARNSFLVSLCHALVVVEAPLRSGARNAALWARRLRKPLFVVPAPPWNPRGLGCIVELKLGALPLYSYRDILQCLGAQGFPAARISKPEQVLPLLHIAHEPLPADSLGSSGCPTPHEQHSRQQRQELPAGKPKAKNPSFEHKLAPRAHRVFDVVRLGARHPDDIASMSGLPMAEVRELLLTLSLSRVLCAHPTGAYTVMPGVVAALQSAPSEQLTDRRVSE